MDLIINDSEIIDAGHEMELDLVAYFRALQSEIELIIESGGDPALIIDKVNKLF
jgi:hypothetical protein